MKDGVIYKLDWHARLLLAAMNLQLTAKPRSFTGSTAGIGNAIAASLAGEGATVIVNGRKTDAVEAAW